MSNVRVATLAEHPSVLTDLTSIEESLAAIERMDAAIDRAGRLGRPVVTTASL
jgi:hypothetical protein